MASRKAKKAWPKGPSARPFSWQRFRIVLILFLVLEELALNHPQLTLGQVYAALAYYADHRGQLDEQIAASEREAERMYAEPRHRVVSSRLKR